jgi:hypothetical protein
MSNRLKICLRDLLLRRMMETGGTMKIAKNNENELNTPDRSTCSVGFRLSNFEDAKACDSRIVCFC